MGYRNMVHNRERIALELSRSMGKKEKSTIKMVYITRAEDWQCYRTSRNE